VDDTGYQTVQSEIAQASGGAFGVGIGAGRAKQLLPATTTDFIMATIGEEFGLWGSLLVLAVLGGIVARLIVLANRAKDRYRMLILYGVACWLGVQTTVAVCEFRRIQPLCPMDFARNLPSMYGSGSEGSGLESCRSVEGSACASLEWPTIACC
jgi:cell division protein FtsW (lipid II flippase)